MHNSSERINIKRSPKISIGIVVYNGVAHIKKALDSVVTLSYKNIELIVVDGGSTDGTLSVLDEYSKYISIFVSEKDSGIYEAMNKVCALATGDWLVFIGCDDVLLNVLDDISEELIQPEVVYYGDAVIRSLGLVEGGKFSKFRLIHRNICHQAIFYPKPIYKKYSYSLNYRWLADYDYNIRLVGDGIPFVYTGVVVLIYNDTGGSSSGDVEFEENKQKIIYDSFGAKYALAYAVIKVLRRLIPKEFKKIFRR
jgi:glycosyltransferase involved in cell wall biosynthesis